MVECFQHCPVRTVYSYLHRDSRVPLPFAFRAYTDSGASWRTTKATRQASMQLFPAVGSRTVLQ